jgi:exosortase
MMAVLITTAIPKPRRNWSLFGILVLGVLLVLLFLRLRTDWEVNPQYSYGWLVPFLAAWLLWRRWSDRPAARPGSAAGAVTVVIASAIMLLPIRLIEEANPEWRLVLWTHGVAVLTLCFAYAFYCGGWPWVKHFAVPLCFLLICIPWPTAVEQRTIQALTRLVAAVTVELAGLMGIGAVQHGNLIEISRGMVGVEEACSGVRSLQTSLMIGVFAGEAFRCTAFKRVLLLAIGLLFAFLLNLGRTTFLVWSAAHGGVTKIEARHDIAGLVASVVLFALLWFLARHWARAAKIPAQPSPADFRPWPFALSVAVLIFAVGAEALTEAWYRFHEADFVATPRWSIDWPTNRTAFRPVEVSETAQSMLRCDASHGAAWRDEDDNQWLLFFLRWGSGKNSAQLAKSHTPDVCIPATGSKLIRELDTQTFLVRGLPLPFKHYIFDEQGRQLHVFHCLWEDRVSKRAVNLREDWTAASRLRAARYGKRHLGQQSLEMGVSGPASAEDAQAALRRELDRLLHVPREVASLPAGSP